MSVVIKKSPEGCVVIVRGWGFVTRSNLMPQDEAIELAAELEFSGKKKERVRA